NCPVVNITIQKLDVLTALRPYKVVRYGFVIMQEIILDYVAPIAEAKDEISMAEVSVVLHQVPEDGPRPDFHHGLGNIVGIPAKSHSSSSAKQNHFHNSPLLSTSNHRNFGNGHDKAATPLADVLQLLHDLIPQIPGQNDDVIGPRFADAVRM